MSGAAFPEQNCGLSVKIPRPSQAIKKLIDQEFTPLTGIEVEWELIPLDRVLARILSDVGQKSGGHDIFYLDQAWVANFAMDCTPVWMLLQNQDLLYPGYALDDLLLPLMEHVASSQGGADRYPL